MGGGQEDQARDGVPAGRAQPRKHLTATSGECGLEHRPVLSDDPPRRPLLG
jgi:hypothetical protein